MSSHPVLPAPQAHHPRLCFHQTYRSSIHPEGWPSSCLRPSLCCSAGRAAPRLHSPLCSPLSLVNSDLSFRTTLREPFPDFLKTSSVSGTTHSHNTWCCSLYHLCNIISHAHLSGLWLMCLPHEAFLPSALGVHCWVKTRTSMIVCE